jgi:hypothetical protein
MSKVVANSEVIEIWIGGDAKGNCGSFVATLLWMTAREGKTPETVTVAGDSGCVQDETAQEKNNGRLIP